MSEPVTILFVGDVVGGTGKRTLLALLPSLRDRYAPDFVVVNGENAAGGVGITPSRPRSPSTTHHPWPGWLARKLAGRTIRSSSSRYGYTSLWR